MSCESVLDKLNWKDIKILLTINLNTIDELERLTGYNYHQVRVSLNKLRSLGLVEGEHFTGRKLSYILTSKGSLVLDYLLKCIKKEVKV